MKKWIIGKETGRNGYEHWQIRCKVSRQDFFEHVHAEAPFFAIFKAQDEWEYERKEAHFTSSEDTIDILKVRYGAPKQDQLRRLKWLKIQNDREIDIWYDPEGGQGKSWLVNWLWETGQAYYFPPFSGSIKALVQDVASDFIKHGKRPYVVIDIPRDIKFNSEIIGGLEAIKDGLIKEQRYSSQTINIRGVKILVTTNYKLTAKEIGKLSKDRLIINGKSINGAPHARLRDKNKH